MGGTAEHVPDEVPTITVEELVELLFERNCVPVDVRQPEEKYGAMADPLPGSAIIGYLTLLKTPEKAVRQVSDLQERTRKGSDGRCICIYSTPGGSTGNCAVLCCVLMDVFGFKEESMCTLEGGYIEWKKWRTKHQDRVRAIPLPA